MKWDSVYPSERRRFSNIEQKKIIRSPEPGLDKSIGLACPAPISRLRVEKIEGGLVVAGVVVAANCQVALPVFGCLFVLVGIVLTVASYRGPGQDEAPENYAARLAFTGNSRVLGPACIVVGFLMLAAGIGLCLLTRRARRRERRVGFHCPVHGDFYPLSPVTGSRALGKSESGWGLCFGRPGRLGVEAVGRTPPQCPHTLLSSTRSSISSTPPSPCPTPMPFLVTSGSISSGIVTSMGANVSPDQTFGSIRSLSVSREVASFPLSRTPSPPPCGRESSPSDSPNNDENNRITTQTYIEDEVNRENNNNINNLSCVVQAHSVTIVEPAQAQVIAADVLRGKDCTVQVKGPRNSASRDSVAEIKGPRKTVQIILPDQGDG